MKKKAVRFLSMAVAVMMSTTIVSTAAFADEESPVMTEENLFADEETIVDETTVDETTVEETTEEETTVEEATEEEPKEDEGSFDEVSDDIIPEEGEEELTEDMPEDVPETVISEEEVTEAEADGEEIDDAQIDDGDGDEADENGIMTLAETAFPTEGGEIASGNYILDEDTELTGKIIVSKGVEVTLDLNGHTLYYTGDDSNDIAITIQGGDFTLAGTGGGVLSGGKVYLSNSNSVFTMNGGTITGSTNSGVDMYAGTFYMYDGTITGNEASSGGGVYINNGTFYMYDGSITDNVARGSSSGGGVYVGGGTFDMQGGSITGNQAGEGGGIYYKSDATVTLSAGTISGNTASSNGGGIYVATGDSFTLSGSTIITGNAAGTNGGGIYFRGNDTASITGGVISGNSASLGGGIYFANNSSSTLDTCTMSGGTITGNSADSGGGVYISTRDIFELVGGAIYGNTAATEAADVYAAAGEDMTLMDASYMSASDAVFNGWYADTADARYADASSPEKVEDINDDAAAESLIAAYNVTLSYDLNGEDAEGSVPDAERMDATYTGGTAVFTTASDEGLAKENCHFAGWNTAADGSGISYEAGTDINLTEDTTLYADWHELNYVEAKEATCTEDGNIACWYCEDCGKYFADKDGETEISGEDTVIAALGHDWVVEQTILDDSEDRYEERVGLKCSRCGQEQEEEIVVTTESGDGLTLHSSLNWSDLIDADELAALFESGAEIDFTLAAGKYADSDVPSADKGLIENKIEELWDGYDYTISYMDIEVLMDILHANGDEEIREFTETINPIEITVAIPDELSEADGDTYTVVRVHDGAAEELESTEKDGMLTFSSDKFSTYGLVKLSETEEEPGSTDDPDDNGSTGGTGSTGSTSGTDSSGDTGLNGGSSTGGTDGTGTTGTTGAKTADTNAPILYGILAALAGAAIVTLGLRRRIVRK